MRLPNILLTAAILWLGSVSFAQVGPGGGGLGGVWIDESAAANAQLDAGRDVTLKGSDVSATGSSVDSIRIDSDAANVQVLAGHDINLIANYERFVQLPWPSNLAPAQRVWMAVYTPEEERRLRLHLPEFATASKKAGYEWELIDISEEFECWMASHEYRDAYFANPKLMQPELVGFFEQLVSDVREEIAVKTTEGTIIGCGVMAPASPYEHEPAKPDCANWKQTWTKALSETPGPDVVLMVTGAWEIQTHWLDGKELVPGTDEAAAYVDGQLDQAVEVIRAKTPARIGALQLACAPVIDRGVGQPPVASSHLDLVHWFNERLDALAERHPGDVVILSINDRVCPDDHPVDKLGGVRLRSDGVHWTEEGALQAWTWLLPEVFDLAYRPSS